MTITGGQEAHKVHPFLMSDITILTFIHYVSLITS